MAASRLSGAYSTRRFLDDYLGTLASDLNNKRRKVHAIMVVDSVLDVRAVALPANMSFFLYWVEPLVIAGSLLAEGSFQYEQATCRHISSVSQPGVFSLP